MWKCRKLISERYLPYTAFSFSFVGTGIGFIQSEEGSVITLIGWVFIAVGIIIFLGALIIIKRNEIPPQSTAMRKSKVIWILRSTGDSLTEEKLVEQYHDRIKRVLLYNPESPTFRDHMERFGDSKERAERQIYQLKGELEKHKDIGVRLYNEEPIRRLTFYDPVEGNEPTSKKTRCFVVISNPYIKRKKWKKDIIKNTGDEEKDYRIQLDNFRRVWCKYGGEDDK